MALSGQLSRLGKQSAIYGLGGLVSRILAVLLLPLYTRYLSKGDYGEIETLIALVTVLTIILRFGISSAFFRFYFDADDHDGRRLVLRTSFWFTMTMATLGLVARRRARGTDLRLAVRRPGLGEPRARQRGRALGQMNYEQMTSLFRVEERPVAFVIASLTNVVLTIGGTVLLVVVLDKGPLGVIVGNFTGTLIVYLALLGYRREQLGLQVDRGLLRRMNHFGMPLVPSALLLWMTNFSDRFFLVKLTDTGEVGLYSVGVRVASAMVLLLTAFRTAWPAFAYSIKSDEEAKRTYAWVLTYLVVLSTWVATALTLLSPWLVDWLTDPEFSSASRVVGPLAFAAVSFAGFIVLSIGIGRATPDAVQLGDHRSRRGRQRDAQPHSDPDLRNDGRRDRNGRRLHRDVRGHGLVGAADLPLPVPVAARPHRCRSRRRARDARARSSEPAFPSASA